MIRFCDTNLACAPQTRRCHLRGCRFICTEKKQKTWWSRDFLSSQNRKQQGKPNRSM